MVLVTLITDWHPHSETSAVDLKSETQHTHRNGGPHANEI